MGRESGQGLLRLEPHGLQRGMRVLLANLAWDVLTNKRISETIGIPHLVIDANSIEQFYTLNEHLKTGGVGIICANHISKLDIPAMISTAVMSTSDGLNVAAMPVADKHFHGGNAFMYKVLGKLGILPLRVVNPSDETADEKTILQLTKEFLGKANIILKGKGNVLGLFGDGTRNEDGLLQPFQPGVGRLAQIDPDRTLFLPVGLEKGPHALILRAGKPHLIKDLFEDGIVPRDKQVVADTMLAEVANLLPYNQAWVQ